ncbi:uncharacterized protein LOC136025834 [Artemia franciscana]|uniref:Methyltransferase FkbM domain-containing protein n=1 Tax=Artemia franciscana TaxID=6661 RepID=A0AA88HUP2_ARTSF|nr:hypothetical protein QYM36_012347 [Artemia franciscana]
MFKILAKWLCFGVCIFFLALYFAKIISKGCSGGVSIEDEISFFQHNIIPPYEGEDAWDFQFPLNRNFSAGEYFMASIGSSWIDVLLILEVFFPKKKQRFFAEAGGADGELFGNTIYLEKFKSWNGILIEADPFYFHELLYKRRKTYAVKVCLSTSDSSYSARFQHEGILYKKNGRMRKNTNKGNGRVLYNERGHSGFGKDLKDKKGTERYGEVVTVSCFPFSTVLNKINITEVDVFFLDVEGQELGVLRTIPFQDISIHIIVVEYDGRADYLQQIREFLGAVGYELHDVFHSSWTLGDALFVQKGDYSKSRLKTISNDEIKRIIFKGTGSESTLDGIPNLRDILISQESA